MLIKLYSDSTLLTIFQSLITTIAYQCKSTDFHGTTSATSQIRPTQITVLRRRQFAVAELTDASSPPVQKPLTSLPRPFKSLKKKKRVHLKHRNY